MSRLRLGIDLDGVVADFNAGWTWRYNRDFPGRVPRALRADEVVMWDAPTLLTHFADMQEFWDWVRTCAEGRSLFYGLDPYPGALDALRRLDAEGHDLVILTTKPDFSVDDTYDWLALHEVPSVEVHILTRETPRASTSETFRRDLAILATPPETTCGRRKRLDVRGRASP